MALYDPTVTRLQLLRNGYSPTPNVDKRCMFKGWASAAFVDSLSPEQIQAWIKQHRNYKATGILVRDGLMPIDLDINDEAMMEAMLAAVQRIIPEAHDNAPWRTGKPPKLMIFSRWQASAKHPDMFTRRASRKFIDAAGASHQIEVFGGRPSASGGSSKQVGAFGPHSYAEDDRRKVLHEYDWNDGPTPLQVPLTQLPAVTEQQVLDLLEAFENAAEARGWTPVAAPAKTAGSFLYDITEASRFNVMNGPQDIDYDELCAQDIPCRVDGSFIDGSTHRRDKCLVDFCHAKDDVVGVWDTEGGAWHLPEQLKPAASNEELARRLHDLPDNVVPLAAGPRRRPPRPRASAPLEVKAKWLLATQAYSAIDFTVIDLFEPSAACQMAPKAFQMLYRPWRDVGNYGPEGGKVTLTATGAWEVSHDRTDIAGVRMRPDADFPLYEEAGARYKNTYLAPAHDATGGDLAPFLAFMDRFLPDPIEREWLFDWMAHKQRRPEIPGTAVVFVADDEEDIDNGKFGTGRGLLFRMATKLYGVNYTSPQSFAIVSGTSSQGTYNDWIQGSVLAMIDEAKTASTTGHRRAERNSVYEVLKDTVDPAPKRIRVNPKGRQAYNSVSYCSFWIATNHRNAMAIPKDDRRFTVLRNGRPMTPEERAAMEAWLGSDANIGALAAFLAARSLEGFDMFVPLDTVGKADMAELALSEVDHVMSELATDHTIGLVFTRGHLELEVERHLSGVRSNHWLGLFEAAWTERVTGLKTKNGGPRRIRVGGTQRKLYCFRANLRRVKALPEAAITRECAKWGGEIPIPGLSEVVGSHQKDE